jgi:hypothetical protein
MGDTKVDDFRSGWGHEDIGRLEVAMNDADCIHGHERFGQPDGKPDQLLAYEWSVSCDVLMKVAPWHVLGCQVWMIRLQVGINVSGSTDPAHSLARFNLPSETGSESRGVGQLGPQELEGNPATGGVLGQVDNAHTPRSNAPKSAIGTDDPRVGSLQVFHMRGTLMWAAWRIEVDLLRWETRRWR